MILAPETCIICLKRKTSPNGSGYETLVKVVTTSSAENIIDICQNGNDYQQAQISCLQTTDVISKEFQFHRSCYREYQRKSNKEKNSNEEDFDDERKECFEILANYVEDAVIKEGEIIRMTSLSNTYKNIQEEKGISAKALKPQLLKARIITRFGKKVTFLKTSSTSAEIILSSSQEDAHSKVNNNKEKVRKAAKLIKEEIKSFKGPFSSWPPQPNEIKSENIVIPELLKTFLEAILAEKGGSKRCQRLAKPIGQDILYTTSNGKIKTVKQLQLGVFCKRKTGSKLMVECLNKLGYSISYYEVNRFETFLAEQQSQNACLFSYVPKNVQPSTFVTFVYDDCDHNPESLSGVTMHCTNGIVIQMKVENASNHSQSATAVAAPATYQRRRSFKPCSDDVIAPYYKAKERSQPPKVQTIDINDNLIGNMLSKLSNFIWVVARMKAVNEGKEQHVPSWTGYFSEVTNEEKSQVHNVHFLPAINQSPTKFDTVQEVLKQVKAKAETIGLKHADLVLDHAIYSKALEVLANPNNRHLQDFINLRMGPFHACCIFMAVVGKRFGGADIKEIIIETNLTGPGSVNAVLGGKHYNRGLRVFKTIYEAMFRLKIESFENWMQENGNYNIVAEFLESRELMKLVEKRTKANMQEV